MAWSSERGAILVVGQRIPVSSSRVSLSGLAARYDVEVERRRRRDPGQAVSVDPTRPGSS
jgi:hypothetical protein